MAAHSGALIRFEELFGARRPLIAVVHLLPLPGAPAYRGSMGEVFEAALSEVELFVRHGVEGLIVENLRDTPFYPGRVPAETIAAQAAVVREVVNAAAVPVGVNVLRNDGLAAVAIAAATGARFVRVNVHMGTVVSEQGIVAGESHETTRLRARLGAEVLLLADAGVKHAAPLAGRGLATEVRDLTERGMADAIVVSGPRTGAPTAAADVDEARAHTSLPVLVGSGVTVETLSELYPKADGFIVGSCFKHGGDAVNRVDERRVAAFVEKLARLRA